jgi:hypothetical protein
VWLTILIDFCSIDPSTNHVEKTRTILSVLYNYIDFECLCRYKTLCNYSLLMRSMLYNFFKHWKKVGYNWLIIFQYYYLNSKILLFWNFWKFWTFKFLYFFFLILKYFEILNNFEIGGDIWMRIYMRKHEVYNFIVAC